MATEVVSKEEILKKEKKSGVKWGFIWAFACAVMWGLGYVPLQVIWGIEPLSIGYGFADADTGYLVGSFLDAFVQALTFGIILTVVWAGCTGKWREYKRVITNFRMTKWLFCGALFGGPMAIFGAALATGYIGASFAASVALLSCVVGAFIARAFNHEKFSMKAIIGIAVIIIGGIIIMNPMTIIDNIRNPANDGNIMLGYLGAIMSVVGWGVEGNLSIKALNVTDVDASLPVRFTVELFFWIIILLPVLCVIVGPDKFVDCMCRTFESTGLIFWMFICALSLGFCYAAQYKAFPLIGIGRTLCLCNLYVPVSMIVLSIFLGQSLDFLLVIGAAVAIIGTFVMYWEKGSDDAEASAGGGSDE